MNKEQINIACSSDQNYAVHTCVMLVSLLENINQHAFVNIYILDGGISSKSRKIIEGTLNKYDASVSFIETTDRDKLFEKGLTGKTRLSKTAYYRLLLPEVLTGVDRIIYLDGDLIVRGNILKLWKVDMGGKSIGAVPVLFPFYYDLLSERFNTKPDLGYFNSGVMVMDLKRLRDSDFSIRAIDFLKSNYDKFTNAADQDLLNVMFSYNYHKLDLKWNQTIESYVGRGFKNTPASWYGLYSHDEYKSAKLDPAIVHFDGVLKPWHIGLMHPYKKLYKKYLSQTGFKGLKRNFNFSRIVSFYTYYSLKFIPGFIYKLILPFLVLTYNNKNK